MRVSLLKAVTFVAVAIVMLIATGPLVGLAAAMTGTADVPVWAYSGAFSVLLLAATALALVLDRTGFASLGLVPTRGRVREFVLGFAVGGLLFAMLAVARGARVEAVWTFAGWNGVATACVGLITAFLLLLPEELVFRGYAFQRLVSAVGAWPGIVISAVLFGVYHVVGSGMWAVGAFFQLAMPAVGGVVFGWTAVRTKGLALPIGLHLGGNWVQASVLSFQPQSDTLPAALWTARVTDIQLRSLYAPDLGTHVPFIATMVVATVVVRLALGRRERTA
jgi:membrane protease YdiL (CAAX protease family)